MYKYGWDVLPLQDKRICLEIRSGFACGTKDAEDGIPHLRMNNISANGSINYALVRRIPKEIANKKNLWLKPDDILFCNTNSTALVGKACLFLGWKEQCTYSNHLTRIRCNKKNILPVWLWTCLHKLWIDKFFYSNCKEFIGQSAFGNDKLKSVKIPVPPLNEQERIVSRIEDFQNKLIELEQLQIQTSQQIETFKSSLLAKVFRGEL